MPTQLLLLPSALHLLGVMAYMWLIIVLGQYCQMRGPFKFHVDLTPACTICYIFCSLHWGG